MRRSMLQVLAGLIAAGPGLAQPAGHVEVFQNGGVFSYTLFNDDLAGRAEHLCGLHLAVQAQVAVLGAPTGWSYETDGATYVDWFCTDMAMPYTHHIAPGTSLGGFVIQSTVSVAADSPFIARAWDHAKEEPALWLDGTTPAPFDASTLPCSDVCYPNCDCSTTTPALNVNDFVCFLNKFVSGDPYANCDGSTTPPVVNTNDFICFLNTFAAGCS